MESFGCWYKLEEDLPDNDEKNQIPDFGLHVNFWFLSDILKNKIKSPYLDIGIKIKNYKGLSNLIFSFPFCLQKQNIIDLAPMMSDKDNASIVFNEECEIETQGEYTIIKIPGNENAKNNKLLIFPLYQAVEQIFDLTNYEKRSYITVKFDTFKKYLNRNNDLEAYDDLYIRFRVKDIVLENILYFDSEPFNKSLDSAFSGTRVLDFKINEKRNIDKNITAKMDIEEEQFVQFEQVHFLVMEPSSYDMLSYTQHQMSCRELEKDLWNEYLEVELDDKAGHVLAYHWKVKAEGANKIHDFSCFAKINYQKTQVKTVLAYVLVVLGIGVIGSTIVSATPAFRSCFSEVVDSYAGADFGLDIVGGSIMLLIGWLLGKKK